MVKFDPDRGLSCEANRPLYHYLIDLHTLYIAKKHEGYRSLEKTLKQLPKVQEPISNEKIAAKLDGIGTTFANVIKTFLAENGLYDDSTGNYDLGEEKVTRKKRQNKALTGSTTTTSSVTSASAPSRFSKMSKLGKTYEGSLDFDPNTLLGDNSDSDSRFELFNSQKSATNTRMEGKELRMKTNKAGQMGDDSDDDTGTLFDFNDTSDDCAVLGGSKSHPTTPFSPLCTGSRFHPQAQIRSLLPQQHQQHSSSQKSSNSSSRVSFNSIIFPNQRSSSSLDQPWAINSMLLDDFGHQSVSYMQTDDDWDSKSHSKSTKQPADTTKRGAKKHIDGDSDFDDLQSEPPARATAFKNKVAQPSQNGAGLTSTSQDAVSKPSKSKLAEKTMNEPTDEGDRNLQLQEQHQRLAWLLENPPLPPTLQVVLTPDKIKQQWAVQKEYYTTLGLDTAQMNAHRGKFINSTVQTNEQTRARNEIMQAQHQCEVDEWKSQLEQVRHCIKQASSRPKLTSYSEYEDQTHLAHQVDDMEDNETKTKTKSKNAAKPTNDAVDPKLILKPYIPKPHSIPAAILISNYLINRENYKAVQATGEILKLDQDFIKEHAQHFTRSSIAPYALGSSGVSASPFPQALARFKKELMMTIGKKKQTTVEETKSRGRGKQPVAKTVAKTVSYVQLTKLGMFVAFVCYCRDGDGIDGDAADGSAMGLTQANLVQFCNDAHRLGIPFSVLKQYLKTLPQGDLTEAARKFQLLPFTEYNKSPNREHRNDRIAQDDQQNQDSDDLFDPPKPHSQRGQQRPIIVDEELDPKSKPAPKTKAKSGLTTHSVDKPAVDEITLKSKPQSLLEKLDQKKKSATAATALSSLNKTTRQRFGTTTAAADDDDDDDDDDDASIAQFQNRLTSTAQQLANKVATADGIKVEAAAVKTTSAINPPTSKSIQTTRPISPSPMAHPPFSVAVNASQPVSRLLNHQHPQQTTSSTTIALPPARLSKANPSAGEHPLQPSPSNNNDNNDDNDDNDNNDNNKKKPMNDELPPNDHPNTTQPLIVDSNNITNYSADFDFSTMLPSTYVGASSFDSENWEVPPPLEDYSQQNYEDDNQSESFDQSAMTVDAFEVVNQNHQHTESGHINEHHNPFLIQTITTDAIMNDSRNHLITADASDSHTTTMNDELEANSCQANTFDQFDQYDQFDHNDYYNLFDHQFQDDSKLPQHERNGIDPPQLEEHHSDSQSQTQTHSQQLQHQLQTQQGSQKSHQKSQEEPQELQEPPRSQHQEDSHSQPQEKPQEYQNKSNQELQVELPSITSHYVELNPPSFARQPTTLLDSPISRTTGAVSHSSTNIVSVAETEEIKSLSLLSTITTTTSLSTSSLRSTSTTGSSLYRPKSLHLSLAERRSQASGVRLDSNPMEVNLTIELTEAQQKVEDLLHPKQEVSISRTKRKGTGFGGNTVVCLDETSPPALTPCEVGSGIQDRNGYYNSNEFADISLDLLSLLGGSGVAGDPQPVPQLDVPPIVSITSTSNPFQPDPFGFFGDRGLRPALAQLNDDGTIPRQRDSTTAATTTTTTTTTLASMTPTSHTITSPISLAEPAQTKSLGKKSLYFRVKGITSPPAPRTSSTTLDNPAMPKIATRSTSTVLEKDPDLRDNGMGQRDLNQESLGLNSARKDFTPSGQLLEPFTTPIQHSITSSVSIAPNPKQPLEMTLQEMVDSIQTPAPTDLLLLSQPTQSTLQLRQPVSISQTTSSQSTLPLLSTPQQSQQQSDQPLQLPSNQQQTPADQIPSPIPTATSRPKFSPYSVDFSKAHFYNPSTHEIVLVIDSRERFFDKTTSNAQDTSKAILGSSSSKSPSFSSTPQGTLNNTKIDADTHGVLSRLKKQVPIVRAELAVGDFAWIVRPKRPVSTLDRNSGVQSVELITANDPAQHQYIMLNFIIERKTPDDLASSIQQERYRDQRRRLNESGIDNIIYIIESPTCHANVMQSYRKANGNNKVPSALATIGVEYGFMKVFTSQTTDTIDFLISCHNMIKSYYNNIYKFVTQPFGLNSHLPVIKHEDSFAQFEPLSQISTIASHPLFSHYNLELLRECAQLAEGPSQTPSALPALDSSLRTERLMLLPPETREAYVKTAHSSFQSLITYFQRLLYLIPSQPPPTKHKVTLKSRRGLSSLSRLNPQFSMTQTASQSQTQLHATQSQSQFGFLPLHSQHSSSIFTESMLPHKRKADGHLDDNLVDDDLLIATVAPSSTPSMKDPVIDESGDIVDLGVELSVTTKLTLAQRAKRQRFGSAKTTVDASARADELVQLSSPTQLLNLQDSPSTDGSGSSQTFLTPTIDLNPIGPLFPNLLGTGESLYSFQQRLCKAAELTQTTQLTRCLRQIRGVGVDVADFVSKRYESIANLSQQYQNILYSSDYNTLYDIALKISIKPERYGMSRDGPSIISSPNSNQTSHRLGAFGSYSTLLHELPQSAFGATAAHFLSDLIDPFPIALNVHNSTPYAGKSELQDLIKTIYPNVSEQEYKYRAEIAKLYLTQFNVDPNRRIGPAASQKIYSFIMVDHYG